MAHRVAEAVCIMLPVLRTTSRWKRSKMKFEKPELTHHEISGTNSAGCLRTDSVWNLPLSENAIDAALS